jgi:hypothetical protein
VEFADIRPSILPVIDTRAMPLILNPGSFVSITIGIGHGALAVSLAFLPVTCVDGPVVVPALAVTVAAVVDEETDVTTSIGVLHDAFAVSKARLGMALA